MKHVLRTSIGPFQELFNFQNEESKGRVHSLISTLLSSVYNVFVTGVFYTGFLTMYGMSITDAGILTFIPYFANLFGIFSPKLLSRFPKRKTILLGTRLVYFLLYVVATTVMPQFVQDTDARLTWFIVLVTFAASFNALFSNGITVWLYQFYPENNDLRLRYVSLTQICSSIVSGLVTLGSTLLTDAISNSPFQNQLILIFRYLAFFVMLIDTVSLARAKEYPYQDSAQIHLSQVFTLPFKYKKFLLCMLIMFGWNFISNTITGLWQYHLLNHLGFSYSLISCISIIYPFCMLLLSPFWKRIVRRLSWVKALGITFALYGLPEFFYFFLTEDRVLLFLIPGLFANCIAVGLNLAYGNVLYMNLPKENATAHITFNTIGINLFAFLGLLFGTVISDITGDTSVYMLGMEVYSVQFCNLFRGCSLLLLGAACALGWRHCTSDAEIARVEHLQQLRPKFLRFRDRV